MSRDTPSKGSVLIVDDSDDLRYLMGQILSPQFEIVEAADGKSALEICAKNQFDVIIMDENMPEMAGHQAFLKIREIDAYTPVIFCTGMPTQTNHKRDMQNGAFDYIAKPIDAQGLIHLVEEAYNAKKRIVSKLKASV